MAQLILTIPDAVVGEVIDVFAAAHDWKATDGDKAAFCKRVLIDIIMGVLEAKRGSDAAEAARTQAVAQVRAAVKIT